MPRPRSFSLFSGYRLSAALFTNSRKMVTSNETSIVNLGPGLLRDVWIFAAISIVIVILRAASKARMRKFALDDVLVIFALVSSTNRYYIARLLLRNTGFNGHLTVVHVFDRVDNTHDGHRKRVWPASMGHKP